MFTLAMRHFWNGTWVGLVVSIGAFVLGTFIINEEYNSLKTSDNPPIELHEAATILAMNQRNYDELYVVAGDAIYDTGYYKTTTTNIFLFIPMFKDTTYYSVLEFDGYWLLVQTRSVPDESFTVYTGTFLRISSDEQEMIQELETYFQGDFLPVKLSEKSQREFRMDVWCLSIFGVLFTLSSLLGFYRFIRRRLQPRPKANAEPVVSESG